MIKWDRYGFYVNLKRSSGCGKHKHHAKINAVSNTTSPRKECTVQTSEIVGGFTQESYAVEDQNTKAQLVKLEMIYHNLAKTLRRAFQTLTV